MQISAIVRERLRQLQVNSGVRFDHRRKCFVDENDKRKRGLTEILKQLIPIAGDNDEHPHQNKSRARQGKNDPVLTPEIERFNGSIMARCCTCMEALAHARTCDEIKDRLLDESDDKAHGLLVDYQLTIYATRGGRNALFRHCVKVDPCVGTLLEQLQKKGWSIVGTQLPLYSSAMDVATACDLICTDLATRTELFLVEVKSLLRYSLTSDHNYERIRGRNKNTALRGTPQSYAARHQGQLLCTNHMVQHKFNFNFNQSCVMRVSPGIVRTYKLHQWFISKLPKFIDAIALKTGKKIRKKRNDEKLRVQKPPRQRRVSNKQPKARAPKKSLDKKLK